MSIERKADRQVNKAQLNQIASEQPYPLLFLSVSGAHLYGFASGDSDVDLRGAHILPVNEVVGLSVPRETIGCAELRDGTEIDLVTHDLRKFCQLLLKKNGMVLEQLYSPLVVRTTPEHAELQQVARGCVTRHHAHHYLGFSEQQWRLAEKESPPRIKPLLYVYRVVLTGIHLMRTGEVEANLVTLNRLFRLPHIDELIRAKAESNERAALPRGSLGFHRAEFERLRAELQAAFEASTLPERPGAKPALDDLLIRLRLKGLTGHAD